MFKRLILSTALRRRTSWIIAAILILPFILFFHATSQAPSKGPGGIAGVVFGKEIPWAAFQEQRLWLRRQLENQLGSKVQEEALESLLTRSAWDKLMLVEEAKRTRRRVDDQELARFIQGIAEFQQNGRFIPERYHRFLRASGMSPQTFEGRLRNDLLVEQLVNSIKASVVVTDEEVRAAYTHAHEGLKASLILVDPATFVDEAAAALTEEEIRAHYDAHPEDVRIPEQLMMEYAGVSREELAAHIQLSEEEVDALYQDHQDQFAKADGTTKPLEEVTELVRQQLTNERVRKQLTTLALDLEEDVEVKLRFEEIVTTRALTHHSAGPLPAGNPWVPGGPEPAVLQAVAELGEGQMSSVIEAENGIYIARVTQRIPSRISAFDEVRGQIRERLVQERARERARTAAEALRAHLKERQAAGLRFEEVVVLEGVVPVTPEPFTRTQPIDPIGSVPAVNEAAFATPLGSLAEVIDVPLGFVIIRPEERFPADESKFAEVQAPLREELLSQRQSARVEEWLRDLRIRAKLRSFLDASPLGS